MSKTLTVAASVGEAVFALLYGMSKSAESATVRDVHGPTSHCCHCLGIATQQLCKIKLTIAWLPESR